MPDIDPNAPAQPIVVPATATAIQAATLAKDLVTVLAAVPALVAVLGTHNLSQIIAFLTGSSFADAFGVLTLAAIMIWRQVSARVDHAQAVRMANAADNSVAIVKGN